MKGGIGRYIRHWRERRILKRHPIDAGLWHGETRRLPLLQGLDAVQRAQLRTLATLFLHRKSFTGVQGLEVTDAMRVVVAAQACVLIRGLGLDYFRDWVEIVLYPEAFHVSREQRDADGVVHSTEDTLSGESWLRGPVILSWADVERDSYRPHPGRHVVLHEFAHKLDALNGAVNGMPPLHPGMSRERWTEALSGAYLTLRQRLAEGRPGCLNAYAATDPAEFFAVLSEYFFTAPADLRQDCPEVYRQLAQFYRQDPLASEVTPVPGSGRGSRRSGRP